jgi:hypothetical protein
MYCRQNVRSDSPSPPFTDLDFEWFEINERQPLLRFRRFDDDFLDQWHFFNNFHERIYRPQLFNLRLYQRRSVPLLPTRLQYFEYHFSF